MAECHPVGLPVGDGGQAARRDAHPRRPALHAHRARWPTCTCRSAPGTDIAFLGGIVRYVLENERDFREYVVALHQRRRRSSSRGLPRHRGPRRAVLAAGTPETGSYDTSSWQYEGVESARPPASASTGDPTGEAGPRRARRAARAPASRRETRRDAAAPALRLPDPEAPLRPLHAGDGRADLRRAARRCSSRSPRRCARTRPRAHRGVLLRGRLDAAHGRRAVHPHRGDPPAAARATSAGRAAASWRCAGTRRSRARPTSRRSTTCCPATCRCRTPTHDATLRGLPRATTRRRPAAGATCRKYIVSLLKAWFGDAATAENDFCFDYLPRLTGDHSHLTRRWWTWPTARSRATS